MLTRSLLSLILALLIAVPGAAQRRASTVQYSQLPYWEVGILDPDLSTLCATGRFNQLDLYAFNYVFNGPVGAAILGVAKNDWNLSDPGHAAKPNSSYYFLRDRTTNCQVYRWGPGDERKKQGPPSDFETYKQLLDEAYQFRLVAPRAASPAEGAGGQP